MERKADTNEINKLFEEAVMCFNRPDAETAYKMFQKVIEMDPKFRIGDGDEDPGNNPYFYMGRYHEYYLGDFETAKEYYTKSVELCPNDFASYEHRGFCWLKENQYELALEDLRKAIKLVDIFDEDTVIDFDDIIIEVENRLGGGKPNKEYDGLFNSGV
jgi:tetratricopeptide (TPR) repeat protein